MWLDRCGVSLCCRSSWAQRPAWPEGGGMPTSGSRTGTRPETCRWGVLQLRCCQAIGGAWSPSLARRSPPSIRNGVPSHHQGGGAAALSWGGLNHWGWLSTAHLPSSLRGAPSDAAASFARRFRLDFEIGQHGLSASAVLTVCGHTSDRCGEGTRVCRFLDCVCVRVAFVVLFSLLVYLHPCEFCLWYSADCSMIDAW